MAVVIRPPITGDAVLDSWTNQITQSLNLTISSGVVSAGGSATGTAGPAGVNGLNSATIYLYRITERNIAPDAPNLRTTYTYATQQLVDTEGNTGDATDATDAIGGGWYRTVPAQTVQQGGFIWITSVNVADSDTTDLIETATWTPPALLSRSLADAPTPLAPIMILFTQIDADFGTLTYEVDATDLELGGLTVTLEQFETNLDDFVTVATIVPEGTMNTYLVNNLDSFTAASRYRLVARNFVGVPGPASAEFLFTPPTPSNVEGLTYVRDTATTATLSWTYANNLSRVKYFIIEFREIVPGDTTIRAFAQSATADAGVTQIQLAGLDTDSHTRVYRVTAVSLQGTVGNPSAELEVQPPIVEPPTSFTTVPLELVGVLTTVNLAWTRPVNPLNTLTSLTIQFRTVSLPPAEWADVQTVSAEDTEASTTPPQQGFVQYRIRYTAVNGRNSAFAEAGSIFVSGGSATDAAVYGSDGAYVSMPHYSINDDDKTAEAFGGDIIVVAGGTADPLTGIVEGIDGEQLEVDWIIAVNNTEITRLRHFYLDFGDSLEGVGALPVDWRVGNETVFLEVLSSPGTSAEMYDPTTVGPDPLPFAPDGDFIFTDEGSGTGSIRTNDRRNVGGFMYATRNFIRLPLTRTFTFREGGSVTIRMRFISNSVSHPRLTIRPKAVDFIPMTLQAYATELQQTFSMNATVAGTPILFGNNREGLDFFEARPMVLITPGQDLGDNGRVFFTNATEKGVTIHSSPEGPVDVTVRGR